MLDVLVALLIAVLVFWVCTWFMHPVLALLVAVIAMIVAINGSVIRARR